MPITQSNKRKGVILLPQWLLIHSAITFAMSFEDPLKLINTLLMALSVFNANQEVKMALISKEIQYLLIDLEKS